MKERLILELLLVLAGVVVTSVLMLFAAPNIGLMVFLWTLQFGWSWNVPKVAAWIIKRREVKQTTTDD